MKVLEIGNKGNYFLLVLPFKYKYRTLSIFFLSSFFYLRAFTETIVITLHTQFYSLLLLSFPFGDFPVLLCNLCTYSLSWLRTISLSGCAPVHHGLIRELEKQSAGDFTQTDFTQDLKGGGLLGASSLGWSRSQTVLPAELLLGDHDHVL